MSTDATDMLFEPPIEEDMVLFAFKQQDGSTEKLQARKTVLSNVSPVFESMFGDRWETGKIVDMADEVKFEQLDTFRTFLKLVYGMDIYKTLSFPTVCHVYFYSEKYQIEPIVIRLRQELESRIPIEEPGVRKPIFRYYDVKAAVELIDTFPFEEMKERLDRMEIELDRENCIKFYQLAIEYRMRGLEEKIVDMITDQEPTDEWPFALQRLRELELDSGHYKIFIVEKGQDTFPLFVNKDMTTKLIMSMITSKTGVPVNDQRLLLRPPHPNVLIGPHSADEKKLSDYGLGKRSIIHLLVTTRLNCN